MDKIRIDGGRDEATGWGLNVELSGLTIIDLVSSPHNGPAERCFQPVHDRLDRTTAAHG